MCFVISVHKRLKADYIELKSKNVILNN
ncbi:glyceraldehyde-3-phosphate dehydrogenase [Bacillus sp. NRRL B-14911]|nr:glyceraldehyde-3-phosphate dehydrogenase [Bacillus sp. NRRL B-14911]